MPTQVQTMAPPPAAAAGTQLKPKRSLEASKLLYILVQDDPLPGAKEGEQGPTYRYTRGLLQSTLQLMGCKARHATKISEQVFDVIKGQMPPKMPKRDRFMGLAPLAEIPKRSSKVYDPKGFLVNPKPMKKRSTTTIPREKFLDVVCDGLKKYHYVGVRQRLDLMVACRIRERRSSITVLLCGTSGCGKSTLATLLGQRLGVTTVVSTDSVRHMMRGFISEQENPLLWASTYHAGEFLDPQAVSDKINKTREKMPTSLEASVKSHPPPTPTAAAAAEDASHATAFEDGDAPATAEKLEKADSLVGPKVMAIEGFKAQSEMVVDSVDRLITAWEAKKESVVVEGVHLSINFVMKLMKKHPSIIPFMVYIANEGKHMQRFAVRAKMMTLDPAKNKYVKYIKNIRTIQDYLCRGADKHLIPKVNNTNVDKSVAAIHATVFSCLRRCDAGETLLDAKSGVVKVIHEEWDKQFNSSALGSKSMFQLIQRRGSSRNMMAVVNADGLVAKAWPLAPLQLQDKDKRAAGMSSVFEGYRTVGTPIVGPFSVGKAEPVRLHFGALGLRDWPENSTEAAASSGYASSNNDVPAPAGAAAADQVQAHVEGTGGRDDPTLPKEPAEDVMASGSDDDYDEAEEEIRKDEVNKSDIEPQRVEEHDDEGSVDNESVRSEGEDDFEVGEEDDDYWDYDESSPTSSRTSGSPASRAERIGRLRSFDRAAAGKGAPELRKTVSYSRASSRRHVPKPTL